MRKILALSLLLAFLLLIPTAGLWAGTIDVFTLTGTWSGTTGSQPFAALPFTLNFTAPASPTPFAFSSSGFQISVNGSYTNNGTTTPFSTPFAQFFTPGSFSLVINNFLTPSDEIIFENPVAGPLLFSGPTSSPTFILGTYSFTPGVNGDLVDYFPPPGSFATSENFSGTLTIAPAPVPEPSSLLLLGTGLLGVVGAARRKWLR